MPVKDLASLSVSGVFFTCPLTGATLTKSEREVHIKEAILMVSLEKRWCETVVKMLLDCVLLMKHVTCLYCQRFEEDAVEASVMMIHTFNKDRDKVKAAVEIMSK